MDFNNIKEELCSSKKIDTDCISIIAKQILDRIHDDKLKIIDLVQGLDPILTNGSHEIRLRGVELLSKVIISLPKTFLNLKEIEVLNEFICFRLIDHKTMEQPTLSCLDYFVQCHNRPKDYHENILDFLTHKVDVNRMGSKSRATVYELSRKIVVDRYQNNIAMDLKLVYAVVHFMEGESNPENLLICFGIVSFILKKFKNIEPYTDDIFEWLSSYYPIDYTPDESSSNVGNNIQRSDLVDALYECFYATELNSENLQTLLLEKLESNLMSTKIESLSCLIRCYEIFPFKTIKSYASSLWTAVRTQCLKKVTLVDPHLLKLSYQALSALATRLSEDNEHYFNFISDIYGELSIAFRKPELDLYHPASCLITHIIEPQVKGFNYVLKEILPTTLNAIKAGELRPISGLIYFFDNLALHHPKTTLSLGPSLSIDELALQILETISVNEESIRLLDSMVNCRIDFGEQTLDKIIEKLFSDTVKSSPELEECAAHVCLNYNRLDILVGDVQEIVPDLEILLENVTFFKDRIINETSIKYSVYLRIIYILLDSISGTQLNNVGVEKLNNFLTDIRSLAVVIKDNQRIVEQSALVHAIIINKLDEGLVQQVLMKLFNSDYCQKLVSDGTAIDDVLTELVYLPTLKWILKSLVVKNNQLAYPMINLILNFICSDKIEDSLALNGCYSFSFVQQKNEDALQYLKDKYYQVFALYQQKFYMQSRKEIKLRYERNDETSKKCLLFCSLALQIPQIPVSVYKRDYEWLLREIVKLLKLKDITEKEQVILVLYQCLESLIKQDVTNNLVGLLGSFINLNLDFACEAKTLEVRRKALVCLASIATQYKHTELLFLKPTVVDKLRICLSDKKRLVRQAAADARSKWILIGQPIGS